MNYREDLEIKLQKVTLAMQEVVEDVYKTEQEKQKIIGKLIDFKEAIISKGIELNIESVSYTHLTLPTILPV